MGKNLIPGNRVDVIWVMTESHEALGGPFSLRLLENVRVLAVGQNSTVAAGADSRRDLKSVTLEVKAKMDENLVLAQELGRLSLAMRNPNDQQTNEPMLVTSISNLLEKAAREKVEERDGPALKAVDQLKGIVEGLAKRIESLTLSPASSAALTAESLQRIPAGMRAITIQTPSEATGVAGLLLPGHRVDVVVTWDGQVFDRFNVLARERESRSIVLLENVEVLAVDTQLVARDGDVENKEMSRSVTLIVTLEMGRQISQAAEIGTLTLVLRGKEDSLSSEPQLVVNLDQYLGNCLAEIRPIQTEVVGKPGSNSIVPIRLNRGGANQDQMFLLRDPERFPSK
jgi:Flp pilus assembly protein CpaB